MLFWPGALKGGRADDTGTAPPDPGRPGPLRPAGQPDETGRLAWAQAIDEAWDYYREQDPFLRGQLLQLRYLEHRTVEDTMERLRVGKSTYQKADSDLLSTVAINAARYGLL